MNASRIKKGAKTKKEIKYVIFYFLILSFFYSSSFQLSTRYERLVSNNFS